MVPQKCLKILWKYTNIPAPWKGGAYERLIGMMKTWLKRAIGKNLLSETEFENIVLRVEGILNSRPLSEVSEDSIEVLRPEDFLQPFPAMSDENYTAPNHSTFSV